VNCVKQLLIQYELSNLTKLFVSDAAVRAENRTTLVDTTGGAGPPVTVAQFNEIFGEFKKGVESDIKRKFDSLRVLPEDIQEQHIATLSRQGPVAPCRSEEEHAKKRAGKHPGELGLYTYDNRFWDVPQGFAFPARVTREAGWKLWMLGMPDHTTLGENGDRIKSPIKPFRNLLPSRLPKSIADSYKLHWRPIFKMMEEGLENIPPTPMSIEACDAMYCTATEFLKSRVSYVFQNANSRHAKWTIATWSKHVGRSTILQHGTEADKLKLPEETRFSRARASGKKRQRTSLEQGTYETRHPDARQHGDDESGEGDLKVG
jgi:hypothetical protein